LARKRPSDAKWGLALHPKNEEKPSEKTPPSPPTKKKKTKKTIDARY